MKYRVKANHISDKEYKKGQIRHANPDDVAALVSSGVLEAIPEKPKAPRKPKAAD